LWTDLADLILEGVAWYSIEDELYARYGHVRDTGEKYYPGYMYRLIMKPIFWGHLARNHANSNAKNGHKTGFWVYDEKEPMPEGAIIFRNTHEPVWTGETADRIKAEIRRRSESVRGSTTPHSTQRFAGLGICAECGSFWATYVNKGYRGIRCPAVFSSRTFAPDCDNRGMHNEKRLVETVNGYLQQMLERQSTDVFSESDTDPREDIEDRIEQLEQEITALELEARNLIRQQMKAGSELQSIYQEELAQINTRLKNMKVTRNTLKSKAAATERTTELQQATLQELAELSLEAFWKQKSRYINQVLHRLMGKKRFLLLDGEIIGVAEINRRQRTRA